MKPLIGVSSTERIVENKTCSHLDLDHIHAISNAGGIPIILPNSGDSETIDQLVQQLDGLYLSGGEDIDPMLYEESPIPKLGEIKPNRDVYELDITKRMIDIQKPVFGVCRGCQVINVVLGGNLYQDLYEQNKDKPLIKHEQQTPLAHVTHDLTIEKDTFLHQLTGVTKATINSLHHQSVKKLGCSLRVSATSEDSIIEAIEGTGGHFLVGVQWHPESLAVKNDQVSKQIFEGFIKACAQKMNVNE